MINVYFIVNEKAGNGKGKKQWDIIEKQITFPYKLFKTVGPDSAISFIKSIPEHNESQLVIAIGGDGTIHEVINGAAYRSDIIIGFMKAGSGNDFARGIQCFHSIQEVESFIKANGRVQTIDIGKIKAPSLNRYFVNNCGLGFDAYVTHLVNTSQVKKFFNRLHLGRLSYIYIMLRALITYEPFELEVVQKNERRHYKNVWFVTGSNQPYFGGGMKISPLSNIADSKLEITVVSNLPRWKFVLLFLTVYKGNHLQYKEVEQFIIEKVILRPNVFVHCHTDGESYLLETMEYEIEVQSNALYIAKSISQNEHF